MTALSAFELLLKCIRARKAFAATGKHAAYGRAVEEKDAALDAAIEQLSSEMRRILTPPDDETEPQP